MDTRHWILFLLWILYCAWHSFFAARSVKIYISKIAGSSFRFYRLGYSLFAALTLVLLLWYQFSMQSIWLYSSLLPRYASIILVIPGLLIMMVCMRKYFYDLSGVQALEKNKLPATPTLRQDGLHKYVRHPLYFGTLVFVWGLFLLFPLLNNLIADAVITVYVIIGIHLEEKKLLLEYGEEYRQYSGRVPRLIPKLPLW